METHPLDFLDDPAAFKEKAGELDTMDEEARAPLLDELERGGFKVDRTRAARGFARRLEEAVSEIPGGSALESILHQLAGAAEAPARPSLHTESTYND